MCPNRAWKMRSANGEGLDGGNTLLARCISLGKFALLSKRT